MNFILRGNKVLLDKPEKKEKEEGKLDLILTDEMEKDAEKDMMKEWTHLNVFAVGSEVSDVKAGDKVYVRTGALHSAEIIDMDGNIKMMVTVHDIVMVWQ
jgi:formate dehydrogenase assembly factor FdhD